MDRKNMAIEKAKNIEKEMIETFKDRKKPTRKTMKNKQMNWYKREPYTNGSLKRKEREQKIPQKIRQKMWGNGKKLMAIEKAKILWF